MKDELTARRFINQIFKELESGEEAVVEPLPNIDWRILLKNAIINTKKDVTLAVFRIEQVVYGKALIRDNNISYKITFVLLDESLAISIPVGSRMVC